jgi:hypothetical protein
MGSVGLLPWIAHPLFYGLVFIGWFTDEISHAGALIWVALWFAGFLLLPRLLPGGFLLFPACVALLDIVLVFVVIKGDVRLR